MHSGISAVELTIVTVLFVAVAFIGFAAVRWRRAQDLMQLDEWGLGGRKFGSFVTWFLLGGDLYTAYTFVAVPALIFGAGALGFFAIPYTIIAYPLVFMFLPRLWSVSHVHGYVTPADFVRGRFGSRTLALAVALTGILATMPYIALQLVGIQVVLTVIGIGGKSTNSFVQDLPLFIAFAVLAAYTYTSGLRAPALIAFVKDILIYIVIIVALLYIPAKIGGWDHIFTTAEKGLKLRKPPGSLYLSPKNQWVYITLAVGSAAALFMYPHAITGTLSTRSRNVIRRNTVFLPAYSLLLGLIALLGYMALAAKGVPAHVKAGGNTQLAVPLLFDAVFPSWFTGIAFAAIAIGALVPAAIMSIAAANLFTRNVYTEFIRPGASPSEETRVAQLTSLVVKIGALVFVLALSKTFAINLQLLGGIWILQTAPSVMLGLFTRLHRWGLLAGWLAGMLYGSITAYNVSGPTQSHFAAQYDYIPFTSTKVYIGVTALVINMALAVVITVLLNLLKVPNGADETLPAHYKADFDHPRVVREKAGAGGPTLGGKGEMGAATE